MKGEIFLQLINREIFNDMDVLGFVCHEKYNKNYYISSIKKKAKRKKIYMCEKNYNDYLRFKSKKSKGG
jgi:hypothetical protein